MLDDSLMESAISENFLAAFYQRKYLPEFVPDYLITELVSLKNRLPMFCGDGLVA